MKQYIWIAVTASSNFNGPLFNGLDGALVYYRSQDEGVTWRQNGCSFPSLDTSNFMECLVMYMP